jgi:hypothetical protein
MPVSKYNLDDFVGLRRFGGAEAAFTSKACPEQSLSRHLL